MQVHVNCLEWISSNDEPVPIGKRIEITKSDSLAGGRPPWIGLSVRVVGQKHGKKGYIGTVKDVQLGQKTKSGIKLSVLFDRQVNFDRTNALDTLDYDDVVELRSAFRTIFKAQLTIR